MRQAGWPMPGLRRVTTATAGFRNALIEGPVSSHSDEQQVKLKNSEAGIRAPDGGRGRGGSHSSGLGGCGWGRSNKVPSRLRLFLTAGQSLNVLHPSIIANISQNRQMKIAAKPTPLFCYSSGVMLISIQLCRAP